jgi:hypothetical protein
MLISVLDYMNSESFKPETIKNPDALKLILIDENEIVRESAISIY